jgi:hypothetical protein
MPELLMTALTPRTRKPARTLLATGAVVLGFGLFAASAQAAPAGVFAFDGLRSPGLEIQTVASSKRYKRNRVYVGQDYPPDRYPSYPDYAKQRYMPYGGSNEILELQRMFPSTNWPQSMDYFD